MTSIDWPGALDRVVSLVRARKSARSELLEAEFSSFTSEALEAQEFLIRALETLRERFSSSVKRAERLLDRNDTADEMMSIREDLDGILDKIESERHVKRAQRMALSNIAHIRSEREYFEKSVLVVVSDKERRAFQDFYEAIGNTFRGPDSKYFHSLAKGLFKARGSLNHISKLPKDLDESQKKQLIEVLLETQRYLEMVRDECQHQYALTKALHDQIRHSLISN